VTKDDDPLRSMYQPPACGNSRLLAEGQDQTTEYELKGTRPRASPPIPVQPPKSREPARTTEPTKLGAKPSCQHLGHHGRYIAQRCIRARSAHAVKTLDKSSAPTLLANRNRAPCRDTEQQATASRPAKQNSKYISTIFGNPFLAR